MDVEYSLGSESLCFYHAVKAVVENDDKIIASVSRHFESDPYGSGYLGSVCERCFPPEPEEDEEEEE